MRNSIIILLSGPMGVGKSTAAQMLRNYLGTQSEVMAFAGPLKEFCEESCQDLIKYWNSLPTAPYFIPKKTGWYDKKTPMNRILLQMIGTDIVRKINPNYWAELAFAKARASKCTYVIFDDWRFPNERHIFVDSGMTVMTGKVMGPQTVTTSTGSGHISETIISDFTEYDFVIDNQRMNQAALRDEVVEVGAQIIQDLLP